MVKKFEAYHLDGSRELRRALRKAGDDLSDMKAAHRAAAEIVTAATLRAVPRVTGRLARTVRPGASKVSATVRAGARRVPYAFAVHWGRMYWPSKEAQPNPPRSQHQAFVYPRYYITKPASETEPKWIEEYLSRVNQIKETIEEEARP